MPSAEPGARAAGLRQELLVPLREIAALTAALLHTFQARPGPGAEDAGKLHEAADALLALAESALDGSRAEYRGAGGEAHVSRVRHDLGNRLNQVSGFAQLLAFAQPQVAAGELQRVKALCQECERLLLRYRQPVPAEPCPASEEETPSAVVRLALSEIRAATGADPARPPGEGGDLLLVDDDPRGREILGRLLRLQGHRTWEAGDGVAALRMLEERSFDLVLLDLVMPAMNGFEVLQQLKARPGLCRASVLIVSALEEMHGVARCIEMGAEDYLVKPIDPVLLRARINSCLQRRQARQRELEQFFPAEVARLLMRQPELLAESRETDVTVLFCDIRRFSRISESLGPGKSVGWLNAVMEVLSQCVLDHRGVVVDFIGDELMAMWGAPEEQPDHARLACRAALDMLARLPALNAEWEPVLGQPTALGIGINSGPARVGNTGTRRKFKYGPLGNTVNLASRVQGATKYLKAPLLVTGVTRRHLGEEFAVRRLAQVHAVNIEEPVDLYEMVPAGRPSWDDVRPRYETALTLFEANRLREAAEQLASLIAQYGAQGPELALMLRTTECLGEPGKWKKVWELPGK